MVGDGLMLTQALIDLLVHAGQTMKARTAPARELRLDIRVGGGRVSLLVCDPGASVQDLGHGSTAGLFAVNRTGAGLGLAMARTIVQAHGGDIAAAEMAGQGAALVVSLPLATEDGA